MSGRGTRSYGTARAAPAYRRLLSSIARAGRETRGAIAVELGIIMPVLLLLCLGLAEGSRAISHQLTIQAAARAGTAYGVVKPPVEGNTDAITGAAKAVLPDYWNTAAADDKASVTASLICQCEVSGAIQCGGTCASGERLQSFIQVDVRKRYVPLFGGPSWFPAMTLSDTSVVRLQ